MASPFAIFRKNQKVMMAALTVLAMIAFVVADAFDWRGRDGGAGDDPVVVETNFFALKESGLRQAMADRELVLNYAGQVIAAVLEQQQMQQMRTQLPQIPLEQLRQFIPYDRIMAQAGEIAVNRFGPASERSVVDTAVLANEALRLGIQINDSMVEEFIFQTVLQGMVPKEQLVASYQMLAARHQRLTYKQLLGAFRNEMLAWVMQTVVATDAARITTPLDRWDYYLRKRCLSTAEVLPVRTKEDVIDKGLVREPKEPEIAEFYEQYRFEEPVPGSPEPGFKIPQKAVFQYAVADEADFFEPEQVTIEEIAAHYDANKTRYPYTAEDFNDTKKSPQPKEPTQVSPECSADATDEGSSCADVAGDEKPADVKESVKTPEVPDTKPQATAQPKPTATPSASPGATPSATAVPAPTATASGTAVAAPSAPLPPAPLPTEDWLLPDDVRAGRTPTSEPLWKVEQKIREELARKAAADKVKKMLDDLKNELTDAALGRDIKSEQPVFTDEQWQALLAKHPGLTGATTPLMTVVEANLAAERPGFFKATVGGEPVARVGFDDSGVYVSKEAIEIPEFALDRERESVKRYLFWKIKNEPARVPELKEIHAEVVFAWKTREARAEARKLADELAAKARQSSQTLAQQFPDRDVKRTNAFAWYETDLSGEFNPQPRPTRVSRVDGVDDAGDEFMQTVFGLDVDQVGTAMNNPETVCYVIRVTTQTPSRDKLYDAFMVDHFQTYQQFSQADVMKHARGALDSLLADANIRWLREPHELRRR